MAKIKLEERGRVLKKIAGMEATWFTSFDISVCGACNRRCLFCPRSNTQAFPNKQEYLSLDLLLKLLKELRAIDYKSRLSFSGFSEPLLHKDLSQMIRLVRKYLADVTLTVITNGDLLTPSGLSEFFRNGLTQIKISLYDGPHQIEHFRKMKEEAGLSDEQVEIRARYVSADLVDYSSIPGFFLSNRAGALKDEKYFPKLAEPLNRVCYYPFYMVMLDYNGDVLLCPHDWHKKLIIGNLYNSSLYELWTSKEMMNVRRTLKNNSRNFKPCNECNIDGTFKGEEAFEIWKRCL